MIKVTVISFTSLITSAVQVCTQCSFKDADIGRLSNGHRNALPNQNLHQNCSTHCFEVNRHQPNLGRAVAYRKVSQTVSWFESFRRVGPERNTSASCYTAGRDAACCSPECSVVVVGGATNCYQRHLIPVGSASLHLRSPRFSSHRSLERLEWKAGEVKELSKTKRKTFPRQTCLDNIKQSKNQRNCNCELSAKICDLFAYSGEVHKHDERWCNTMNNMRT